MHGTFALRRLSVIAAACVVGAGVAPDAQNLVSSYQGAAQAYRDAAAKATASRRPCFLEWARYYDDYAAAVQRGYGEPRQPSLDPGCPASSAPASSAATATTAGSGSGRSGSAAPAGAGSGSSAPTGYAASPSSTGATPAARTASASSPAAAASSAAASSSTSAPPRTASVAAASAPVPASSATNTAARTAATDPEVAMWLVVETAKRASAYQAYLDAYPNGVFRTLAKTRVAELANTNAAAAPVAPSVAAPPAARSKHSVAGTSWSGWFSYDDKKKGNVRLSNYSVTFHANGVASVMFGSDAIQSQWSQVGAEIEIRTPKAAGFCAVKVHAVVSGSEVVGTFERNSSFACSFFAKTWTNIDTGKWNARRVE